MCYIDCNYPAHRAWIFSGKFRLLRCEYHFFLFTHHPLQFHFSNNNQVKIKLILTTKSFSIQVLKFWKSITKRLLNQKPSHDEHSPHWWTLSWRVVRVRPLSCRRPRVPKKQSRCRCGWWGCSSGTVLCECPFSWFTTPFCFTTP